MVSTTQKSWLKYFTLIGIIGLIVWMLLNVVGTEIWYMYRRLFWPMIWSGGLCNTAFYLSVTIFPYICFTVFFAGYFASQKSWTVIKKISLICGVLAMICVVSNVGLAFLQRYVEVYRRLHGDAILNGWLSFIYDSQFIIASLIWVPFCASLLFYKNVPKTIKWLSVPVIISGIVNAVSYGLFVNFFEVYLTATDTA